MEKLYRLLYPVRIVLITSRGEDSSGKKKDNVMTAAWCFPLSGNPPLFGISVVKSRLTYSLIEEGKCFGINLVSPKMREDTLFCGTHTGAQMDKFSEVNLEKVEAEKIDCPMIGDSPVGIECRLVDTFETGDHFLFVGEAVNVVKRAKEKGMYQAGEEWIEV
ncbi:flavin reductase family protein [Candidatus Micrarchaeota archaeon]|nr:flavin reductase family protein [Candidatus Micrarchaeota archaeon]